MSLEDLMENDPGFALGMPPVAQNVVLVDFDKTIVEWGEIMDPDRKAIPFAATAMQLLRDKGFYIVILTSRVSKVWAKSVVGSNGWEQCRFLDQQHAYVASILDKNGVPWDEITAEKRPAEALFDDTAWRVTEEDDLHFKVMDFIYQRISMAL